MEKNLDGAYAYLPAGNERAGDSFYGSDANNPMIGNEAFVYFIHEIDHAMGLDHGHEYPEFVRSGLDSQEYTVVTYSDYVGDNRTYSFDSGVIDWTQSYMQLDIAALQFIYGANYANSGEIWSGDRVYAFDPTTGEMSINDTGQGIPAGNRIFRTIWDGDGTDTYDLSNYSSDRIKDFETGVDVIDLSALSGTPMILILNGPPGRNSASVSVTTFANDTHVSTDIDGDGIAESRIIVENVQNLGASEIIL